MSGETHQVHASQNLSWRMESKLMAGLKHKMYQSESCRNLEAIFHTTLRYWTTERFRFSASSVNLKQTFRPRGFSPLSSLRRIVCIINSRKKGELSVWKNNPHKWRLFLPHSCKVRRQSAISVVHFHWSRLTRHHFQILHYLTTLYSLTIRWHSVYGAREQ